MSTFKSDLNEKDISENIYFLFYCLPIMIAGLMGLSILLFSKFLPQKLPLFYSLPWGDNQLVNHQQFLIIPGSLILITLLNLIISWHLHLAQSFFKKVLLVFCLITTLMLTITFIKIILIFI